MSPKTSLDTGAQRNCAAIRALERTPVGQYRCVPESPLRWSVLGVIARPLWVRNAIALTESCRSTVAAMNTTLATGLTAASGNF